MGYSTGAAETDALLRNATSKSNLNVTVVPSGDVPVLAPDRQGFLLTEKNSRRPNLGDCKGSCIPRLSEETYSDFDICYVFPLEPKKPDQKMSQEEMEKALLRICRARDATMDPSSYGSLASLHPVYQLQGHISKELTRKQFHGIILNCFYNILEHVGACYVIEEGREKNKNTFIRARLIEGASQLLADYFNYPLQFDRHVTTYEEFRRDPDYIPPFLEYRKTAEGLPMQMQAMHDYGRVWARYDRLGRLVEDPSIMEPHSPELSIFRDVDRIRLLKQAVFEFLNMDYLVDEKWAKEYYPLKQKAKEEALSQSWANFGHIYTWIQPLNDIRNYFGEEIALYFAWLGYYTASLIAPAIYGVVLTILVLIFDPHTTYSQRWLNYLRCSYCLFLGGWCAWFFQMWSRKENVLALKWGVDPLEGRFRVKEESPYFTEEGYIVDPTQPDRYVKYYSPNKRRVREMLTTSILVLVTGIVVIAVNDDLSDGLATFMGYPEAKSVGQALLYETGSDNLISAGIFLAACTSILIKIFDKLFSKKVVYMMAKFENHQFLKAHNDSLSFKLFYFKVCDYFAMLLYLAFFKEYFSPCGEGGDGRCIPALRRQLIALVIIELLGSIKELLKPFVKYMIKNLASKAEKDMPQYQKESMMSGYAGGKGLISDYLEQMVQFGFMSFFSLVCPPLPLIVFLVNLVEIRSDAYKLCNTIRRPWPRGGEDMGVWDDIQGAMTFMGMVCNVALCAFATVGYYHGLSFRLFWYLVLMLCAVGMKEIIKYKFPVVSSDYKLIHERHQVVLYSAYWGEKNIEKLARTVGRTSRYVV